MTLTGSVLPENTCIGPSSPTPPRPRTPRRLRPPHHPRRRQIPPEHTPLTLEFIGKNSFELPAHDEFNVGDERSLLESLSAFDPDRPL